MEGQSGFDCISIEPRDWKDTLAAAGGRATLVLTDPPYGTTNNKWEMNLDAAEFYALAFRACNGGAVVCTSAEPFTSHMVVGAGKHFKYCWYWDKKLPTGHLNAKRQPLRRIEPVVVAYTRAVPYYPQKTEDPRGDRRWHRHNTSSGSYNPYEEHTYSSGGEKYPTTLIEAYQSPKTKTHPTEKPTSLMEYLIRTYTAPGDLVVDPFCGTGSVPIACKNTGRRFIGGDTNAEYVGVALQRIAEKSEDKE